MGTLPISEVPFDRPSAKLKNRWIRIGAFYMPTIFRLGFTPLYKYPSVGDPSPSQLQRHFTRYVALRIIKERILPKYTHMFKQCLFDMLKTPAYCMTDMEADVFNYLRQHMCKELFGNEPFSAGDHLLLLQDALRVVEFLNFLATRVIRSPDEVHPNFGFVHFGDNVLYPYYTMEAITFLPSSMCKMAVDANKEHVLPLMVEKIMRILIYLQNKHIFFGQMKFLNIIDFNGGVKVDIYEQWISNCQNCVLMGKRTMKKSGRSVFKLSIISTQLPD